ncbi:MAG: segregation/condensation protein A, partial [Elusimicrobia bacterium]|nr:segregation/condensation protein A [Elusimicrobiota bacterium]
EIMAIAKEYEVHLEMFEGPLDLLLFLIKKDDLDIYDIPISQITQEYLGYLDLMKDLSLEVAGEFLVLASTLMQIKARMLLPSQEVLEDEGPDPRAELVAKLLEYQKFKGAAKFLEDRALEYQDVFYRGSPHFAEAEKSLNIRIFDLLSTLREILDRAEDNGIEVIGEEFPIEEKMQKILFLLESKPYMTFRDAFKDERKRLGILACFMAVLELIKLQKIFARQDRHFGEILLYKREAPPPAAIWPGAEEQAAPAPTAAAPAAPVEAPAAVAEPQVAVAPPQPAAVEPQVAAAEPQVAAPEAQVGAAEREAEVAEPSKPADGPEVK